MSQKFKQHQWWIFTVALATPLVAIAAGVVPHVFTSGTPIASSQVNANFKSVTDRLNAIEARPTEPAITYFYSGAFATPNEWEADLMLNGNYGRFCQEIGKTFVSAKDVLKRHYNSGRGQGFFYKDWYYVGPRHSEVDTLYWAEDDAGKLPTSGYNVWKYSGQRGCCIQVENWTIELTAFITCK